MGLILSLFRRRHETLGVEACTIGIELGYFYDITFQCDEFMMRRHNQKSRYMYILCAWARTVHMVDLYALSLTWRATFARTR